jgi:hypothetical protein
LDKAELLVGSLADNLEDIKATLSELKEREHEIN